MEDLMDMDMSPLRAQNYLFGCELKANQVYHFKVVNIENEHQLSLRTVSLGAGTQDEFHVVEAEAMHYEGSPIKVALATLKMSVHQKVYLGCFEITPSVVLKRTTTWSVGSEQRAVSRCPAVANYSHWNDGSHEEWHHQLPDAADTSPASDSISSSSSSSADDHYEFATKGSQEGSEYSEGSFHSHESHSETEDDRKSSTKEAKDTLRNSRYASQHKKHQHFAKARKVPRDMLPLKKRRTEKTPGSDEETKGNWVAAALSKDSVLFE
ncbi:nucleophosmin-like [Octodon degus]|uniref:Nucleophosmin n=1 Tax=Octodon degus TaxID=10160 RepID=A0A6P3VEE7_OCTDE|nr:nucleophosmin-like [Octodon degus]